MRGIIAQGPDGGNQFFVERLEQKERSVNRLCKTLGFGRPRRRPRTLFKIEDENDDEDE
jgi:hypothetical protein